MKSTRFIDKIRIYLNVFYAEISSKKPVFRSLQTELDRYKKQCRNHFNMLTIIHIPCVEYVSQNETSNQSYLSLLLR